MGKKDLTICEECLFYEKRSKREFSPLVWSCKAKPLDPPISFVTGTAKSRLYEDPHDVNTDGSCAHFERKPAAYSFAALLILFLRHV